MKRTTYTRRTLALLLSVLMVAALSAPHSLDQTGVQRHSMRLMLRAMGSHLAALVEAIFSIAAPGVVLAEDDNDGGDDQGDGSGNHNGDGTNEIVASEVVVEVEAGVDSAAVAQRHHLTILEQLDDSNIFRMGFSSGRTLEGVLDELETDPEVEDAEAHYLVQLPETSHINPRSFVFIDPRSFVFIDGSSPGEYFDQAALRRIKVGEAHSLARGQGVTVAVIDTGIDPAHPVFDEGRRLSPYAYDFVKNDNAPWESCSQDPQEAPGCGHGTFVSGIVSLVAPDAQILPLRAFDAQGQGKAFDIAQAIYYAAGSGAVVINMSFGIKVRSFVIEEALRYASRKGVLLVASAGNENHDLSFYPQYPAVDFDLVHRVITVAAIDAQDVKADFSNYGRSVDLSAPGVGIYGPYPDGRFGTWSGTSFSAPLVAGEAALLYSMTSELYTPNSDTRSYITQTLYQSAININRSNPGMARLLGRGRIDLFEALTNLVGEP